MIEDKDTEDMVELGTVTEDTHGAVIGHSWDGAFGVRYP